MFVLSDEREQTLLDTQTECVFMWTTDAGDPVGVYMNFVERDGVFWLTCTRRRKRVRALEKRPRGAVAVSSRGTDIGISQAITYKGDVVIHDDPETLSWMYKALAEKVRPGDPAQTGGIRAPPRLAGAGRVGAPPRHSGSASTARPCSKAAPRGRAPPGYECREGASVGGRGRCGRGGIAGARRLWVRRRRFDGVRRGWRRRCRSRYRRRRLPLATPKVPMRPMAAAPPTETAAPPAAGSIRPDSGDESDADADADGGVAVDPSIETPEWVESSGWTRP